MASIQNIQLDDFKHCMVHAVKLIETIWMVEYISASDLSLEGVAEVQITAGYQSFFHQIF